MADNKRSEDEQAALKSRSVPKRQDLSAVAHGVAPKPEAIPRPSQSARCIIPTMAQFKRWQDEQAALAFAHGAAPKPEAAPIPRPPQYPRGRMPTMAELMDAHAPTGAVPANRAAGVAASSAPPALPATSTAARTSPSVRASPTARPEPATSPQRPRKKQKRSSPMSSAPSHAPGGTANDPLVIDSD